jgi:ABC-type sugar transport system substrate-binding protein
MANTSSQEAYMSGRFRLVAHNGRGISGATEWNVASQARWRGGALLAVISVLAVYSNGGCDSASFAPPPPDEVENAAGGPASILFTPPPSADVVAPPRAGARAIAIVLARHDLDDAEILKSAARAQAGYEKVKLDITMLGGDDLPAQQAGLVRDALARNPLTLILEPADKEDKRLAEAVLEAERARVPVLLLNRPLSAAVMQSQASPSSSTTSSASPSSSSAAHDSAKAQTASARKQPVFVGAPSFGSAAEQLVESALRNAKNSGLDPKAGAILVINTVSDAFADDRTAALRRALEKAGIKAIEEVRFAYKENLADKIIAERRAANTKAALIFGLDSQCLPPIRQLMTKPEFEKHPFIVAGFVSDDRLIPFAQNGDFAALAEFDPNRLIRKAVTAAAALAQGKDVPQRIDIPILFHDSPPHSGVSKNRGDRPGIPKSAEG